MRLSKLIKSGGADYLPFVKRRDKNIHEKFEDSKLEKFRETIRCRKITIKFTDNQLNIVKDWFETYRISYNIALKYVKNQLFLNKSSGVKSRTIPFITLRNKIISQIPNKSKCPVHTIANAIKDVVSVYKSAVSNLRNKNIKKFRIRYKKICRSITLEASSFSKEHNTFVKSVLGKYIKSSESIKGITHDCKLHWNVNRKDPFTLCVPVTKDVYKPVNSRGMCYLDPGVRTFQSLYDIESFSSLDNGLCNKIGKYIGKIENMKGVVRNDQKRKLSIRLHAKINNIVTDFHHKLAKWLVRKYEDIYIGKISTNKIVKNHQLAGTVKQKLLLMRHFSFRKTLQDKAEIYGSRVHVTDESYTTRICGKCGFDNKDIGRSKVFRCPNCKMVADRDFNAARNILLKGGHY